MSTLDISSAHLNVLLRYIFICLQKTVFKAFLSFKIIDPKYKKSTCALVSFNVQHLSKILLA